MPNYQTSMDILREDAREEELLVRLINKGYLKTVTINFPSYPTRRVSAARGARWVFLGGSLN